MQSWNESTLILPTFTLSASMSNMVKIEEMERLLREAQVEKQRLLEHRVLCRIAAQPWLCESNHG